jgi:predicted nucleotidyltransferase
MGSEAMTPTERQALKRYVEFVRSHYGARLHEVLLFGSRARGDARPDSDFDVAIILDDGDWKFWTEKLRLADLAYDTLIDDGLSIQAWPIERSVWEHPESHSRRRFVEAIRRDGLRLEDAA